MNKLLIATVVIFGLSSFNSAYAAKETEKAEQKAPESTSKTADRTEKNKEARAKRAQKVLEVCEKAVADAELETKSLAGVEKKEADLSLAHAKLEMEAAKDPEMAEKMMYHARRCKHYAGKNAAKISKTDKSVKEVENKKSEAAKS